MGAEGSKLLECTWRDSECEEALRFDRMRIWAQGGNKSIFSGTWNGQDVVVCCCRSSTREDAKRAENEIEKLNVLGRHPHIIRLMSHGIIYGKPYLVLERIEPVGFDLAHLGSQYELMGSKVPSSLSGRLFRQLVGGLRHMHGKRIVHLDLKAENVLVTLEYTAKICDFGIACEVGSIQHVRSGYLPPEVCNGSRVGPEADCWGLGLILHQMYQRGAWNLVDCRSRPCRLREDALCCIDRMPGRVQQVMRALIKQEPSERLTLQGVMESEWLSKDGAEFETPADEWFGLPKLSPPNSRWSVPYRGSSRPLTLSLLVGTKQTHLLDQTLGRLGLCQESAGLPDNRESASVLLLRQPGPGGKAITNPGPDTKVRAGMRIFIGMPVDIEHTEAALQRMYHQLDLSPQSPASRTTPLSASGGRKPSKESAVMQCCLHKDPSLGSATSSTSTLSARSGRKPSKESAMLDYGLHRDDRTDKREVCDRGAMYSFVMEFDCFTFPSHIGDEATIGKVPAASSGGAPTGEQHVALDLKGRFNINLVGIQRAGESDVAWFPDACAVVRPGDLGLLARCPCDDGSSVNAVEADALARLLVEQEFTNALQVKPVKQAEEVGAVMSSQFPDVLAYK